MNLVLSDSQARAWNLGLFLTWPQLSPEARLPEVPVTIAHRLGSSQSSSESQVSVSPTKSLSPSSLSSSTLTPGGLAAPGPFRLPEAGCPGARQEVPPWCRAGKGWLGPLLPLLPRCLSWALGLHRGSQAERPRWAQAVRAGRVLRPRPAAGTCQLLRLSMPQPGSPGPYGCCLAYSFTFPSQIFSKGPPSSLFYLQEMVPQAHLMSWSLHFLSSGVKDH